MEGCGTLNTSIKGLHWRQEDAEVDVISLPSISSGHNNDPQRPIRRNISIPLTPSMISYSVLTESKTKPKMNTLKSVATCVFSEKASCSGNSVQLFPQWRGQPGAGRKTPVLSLVPAVSGMLQQVHMYTHTHHS